MEYNLLSLCKKTELGFWEGGLTSGHLFQARLR